VVSQDAVVRALAVPNELSEEQLNAVWHITTGTGGIAIVSGMAGTGKTRMLEAAKAIWEGDGFSVQGAALAARAVNELANGAGIESSTIAKLLYEAEKGRLKLDLKTILVVDEAGMVATPDFEKLSRLCCEAGAKLVPIGDGRQLQPIGPGAPFVELGVRHGQAELQDIRRQNDAWARRAVKDLAEGRAQEAIEAFVSRGLVKVTETREEAMRALVDDWQRDAKPMKETLLLAGTHVEVDKLNRLAQGVRVEKGELGASEIEIAGSKFRQGDRVMFTTKYATLGVVNGDRGTLSRVDEDRSVVSVHLDSGERVSFEAQAVQHLVLGYASTTHKGQGATTLRTYVLVGGPMQDREISYVQASRAKELTTFYMTRLESGDEMARLAREMERSRRKEMAHTLLRDTPPEIER
jgi:ATP-dependent exoDNAse (exonuclease V) alpha subunit